LKAPNIAKVNDAGLRHIKIVRDLAISETQIDKDFQTGFWQWPERRDVFT